MHRNKILVLTPIYPAPDMPKSDTPIVHYFVREWVKMGYDIHVINYVANFPKPLYWLAKPFKEVIGAKAGFGIRTTPYQDREYEIEKVKVKRICLRKNRPHTLHPRSEIQQAIAKTICYCKENHFVPDYIIGHWPNPQLEIMSVLKDEFKSILCYVSHGDSISKIYKQRTMDLLNKVDVFGFRCDVVQQEFFNEYHIDKPYFMCYSGIPSSFLEGEVKKDFSKIKDFIYVGTLIKRKKTVCIVEALAKAYNDECFNMRYVGIGAESKAIEKAIKRNHVEERVKLLGRVDRNLVRDLVDQSQVFIMISKGEAFGLVYLEAMARGCITIASRNEGFDGIIKDGYNGFLCEAGNSDELSEIIKRIKGMSQGELLQISRNAIATANALTDAKAAKYYLEAVMSASGNHN